MGGLIIAGDWGPGPDGGVSGTHKDGANFLSSAGSAAWYKTSECGLADDDVYTFDGGGDDDAYLIGR